MDKRRKNLERHCYAANLRAHSFFIAVGDHLGLSGCQRRRSGEEVKRVPCCTCQVYLFDIIVLCFASFNQYKL
jgi:hypothetical protein